MSEQDISKAFAFLLEMQQPGMQGKAARIAAVRALAELSRKNTIARMMIENGLSYLEQLPPKSCRAGAAQMYVHIPRFRACYLEGTKRPTARALSARFYAADTCINQSLRIVIAALVPYFCGKIDA